MKVGCAVVSDDFSETMQISDGSSILTAETKAIDLALDSISDCETSNKFVIFSDSLSVLKSLEHTSSKNPQSQKVLEKHHDIAECNEIIYCWIPSHTGIVGNENVDQKAKDALNVHPTNFLERNMYSHLISLCSCQILYMICTVKRLLFYCL